MFRPTFDVPLTGANLTTLLRALTEIDLRYLQQNPNTPSLYSSGVRYIREPIGQEEWLSVPEVLRRGGGDCEDLACWRAAELILRGKRAEPIWRRMPSSVSGQALYHILVRVGLSIEDPSKLLGM